MRLAPAWSFCPHDLNLIPQSLSSRCHPTIQAQGGEGMCPDHMGGSGPLDSGRQASPLPLCLLHNVHILEN